GYIIASVNTAGSALVHVLEGGGLPKPLTSLAVGESNHRWPHVIPGHDTVIFTMGLSTLFDDAAIEAASINTGAAKVLLRRGYFGRYLPTHVSSGHLVYLHQGVFMAAPFDPVKLEVRGNALPILEDVIGDTASGSAQWDVSRTGTLVYLSGKS